MEDNRILEQEIDRYLDGSMTREEKQAFDRRLANDAELRKEVDLQQAIIKAVRKEQLERIIKREENVIRKRNIRKIVISFGSLAIAASLVGFFYMGYMNNCENLYGRYYQSYTISEIPSRGDEKLTFTKSDSIFFNALQNLESGQNKPAIRLLEELNSSSTEMLAASGDAIKWYLSLAYLKNGQKKKAKILLHNLAGNNLSEYKSKAMALLKEL